MELWLCLLAFCDNAPLGMLALIGVGWKYQSVSHASQKDPCSFLSRG
jgi:hypothetical protein